MTNPFCCCRNSPQNEETQEKGAEDIWHHDDGTADAVGQDHTALFLGYNRTSQVDLLFVFLDGTSMP